MTRTLLLTALLAVGAPELTEAQIFEIELGAGYVFGSGAENPGPSVPVFDAGVACWPSARWGIAVRVVDGPGEDLHEPVVFMDRTFFGTGHLRYWTFTARHRRALQPTWGMEIGAGLMTNGRYASVWMFTDQAESRHAGGGSDFAGFSLEGLATKAFSRHFGIKAGVTYDFNFETNNLQPVVLGTIRF